jgi:prepilin-type N-terminal cleavage/methylation domain-containing protein
MKKNGFTLIELLVVIAIIVVIVGAIAFGVIGTGICGNMYYSEKGVLKVIQLEDPQAKKVLSSKRHVFARSEILVERNDGSRVIYLLDSNILLNYELKKK